MDEQDFVTPNDFEGSDTHRINRAIEAAAGMGKRVVIPRTNHAEDGPRDIWLLDSAILVRADTILELNDCHIKLTDRCRDNMIRSANCGKDIDEIEALENIQIRGVGDATLEGADRPRATGDSAKTLGDRTFGTDAGVQGESQTGDWRNIGILLAFVERFSIKSLRIINSHAWAISCERCAHGTLRDLDFASSGHKNIGGTQEPILNQDGVDLRLGCHDILIENITGYTGDDLVALTAIPNADSHPGELESTMVSGAVNRGNGLDDIRHVTISNIRGYCRGGHHIVRLLNTPGVRLHDIILDGLIDTSADVRCKAAVKIGDDVYGGGVAPVGDTSGIIVKNVITRAKHAVLIGGSLCDSIISDVIQRDTQGEGVTMVSGPENVRDTEFSNIRVCGASSPCPG